MSYPSERGIVGRIIGYTLLGVLLVGFIAAGVFALRVLLADVIGAGQAEITTSRGDYRIASYDHFTDLCAAVQAKEDQIAVMRAELRHAHGFRRSQLLTNITALRTSRAELIREYNGDATKDFTRGQFRDSDLPYQLDVDDEDTTCAA
jgi:hypothetical protein